jgi:S-adenosyl methyltransferase
MPEADTVPEGVDPARPSPARMYDYYLGGTHNYEADRQAAEQLRQRMPELADAAWANRGFHGRAAIWMAEQGIRQFIDIGCGLPAPSNTHEAVRKVTPDARVVYVDHDPMVAAGRAPLLAPDGRTAFVAADLRDPDSVLGHPELRRLIDVREPAGVLMTAVLHYVADGSDPRGLVGRYMTAMAPGSYLALSHLTYDQLPPQVAAVAQDIYERAASSIHARTREQVARLFDGLELVPAQPGGEPAVTFAGLWGAEDLEAADSDGSRASYCGVARRP